MYDLKRFYDYEKDFIESTGKHNIFPLSKQGVKLYTDKDSHFVHKYISGRKLDLYPNNGGFDSYGNLNSSISDSNYGQNILHENRYSDKIKENDLNNDHGENIKGLNISKVNNCYAININKNKNEMGKKIIKDVLLSQGNIEVKSDYKEFDSNLYKKERVRSQYIPNTRLYRSPDMKNSNSRLVSHQNNNSRSKSPSPKKENLLLYNHLPKIGNSLKNMENGFKKNGTSPINQANKKIFLSVFGSGSGKDVLNKETDQVEKELLKKQTKYEEILEEQLKNTFCENHNLAKIQNFPKQKKSLLTNIQTNRSFMGLKFNPFNYQFIDFKNKKK